VLREKPEVTTLSIVADILPNGSDPEVSARVHRVWRFNDLRNAWRINQKLRELEPDAVLYNLQFASFGDKRAPAALGLLAPMMTKRAGYPTVTLLHNLFETVDLNGAGFGAGAFMNTTTRVAGRAFTRILLKSDLVALTMPRYVDVIRNTYGAKNVFLAPHGAFDNPGPPPPLPSTPTVMTFGKFGTYKKIDTLLEAHGHLLGRDPRLRLVIAGSDSPNAKGYLQEMAKKYHDLPNVSFIGYVAEEDVAKVFSDATVVAFPYTSTTGSSGVLHQAGQYARAAVMPRIGDLADLVEEEGYRAEYFEPGSVESLREALWNVLSNSDYARELGLNNYSAAVGLSLSDVADWYLLHFEKLIGEKRGNSQATT
jgi:glycosyltransferase involved in cell wall biosynthesis